MMEVMTIVKTVIQVFVLMTGNVQLFRLIERKFLLFYENYLGVSRQIKPGRKVQRAISILFFEDMPMLYLQALTFLNVFQCPKLLKGDAFNAILTSLILTSLGVINNALKIYMESYALDEPYIKYILQSMQAR